MSAVKPKPKPGADRKVIIEYSSDESMDDDAPQENQEGYEALKLVKKPIHLTLPTSPRHVTTTESFTTFFINHGLTKALCKAFEKKGWTTDQMQQLIMNFQQKHGKRVPLPKIYMDEDDSDSEGLKLQDGTRVGRKAGGSGGNGAKSGGKPAAGSSAGGSARAGAKGSVAGSSGGDGGAAGGSTGSGGGSGGDKCSRDDDDDDGDEPGKRRKTCPKPKPPR